MVRLDLLVPHHHCFKTLPNFTRNSFSTPKGSRSVRNARQWMRKLPCFPPNECTGRKVLAARKLTCTDCHPRKKKTVINCTRNSGRLDASLLFYHKHAWLFTIKPATRSSSLTHQKISRFEGLFTWHRRSALKAKTNCSSGEAVASASLWGKAHLQMWW